MVRFRIFALTSCLVILRTALTFAQVSDVTPPQLTQLTVTPGTVDVSSSSQNVVVVLTVTDDLSGVATVGASVGLPSGLFTGACPPTNGTRISGTSLNGTYSATVSVPRNAPAGAWPLRVTLADSAGNAITITAATLASRGLVSQINVISTTPDTVAPQVTALSFLPSSVDASSTDVLVRVRIATMDASSGVLFNPGCFVSPSLTINGPNAQQVRLFRASFSLINGTPQSGIWETSFVIRQFSSGTWTVSTLVLDDVAGNSVFFTTTTLQGLGIDPNLNVTSAIPDLIAPVLTSFNIAPLVINTAAGPQPVTFTFGLHDDLSGVSFAPDTFFNRIFFTSPSGSQTNRILQTDFRLLSGDAINGLWEATMVFPQFSESGTWRPTLFRLEDRVHNVRNMTSTSLDAAGFPSKIVVFQPSLTSDGSVSVAGGTIQDETFGSRVSLTFPFGAVSIPTSVALDVLQSPLDVPLPTGFSGADSFFVNIELTPMPGFPLAAPGLTLVLPLRVFTAPGTAIYLFRVNPATGNLEPALDAIGTQIVGFANASGLEATFIGISSLSTVVGLRSGPITLSIDIKPDDLSNVVNLRSRGTVPVVIYSTPTLNSTLIDPATLRLAGAAVATNKSGRAQTSEVDFDGDGLLDLIAHFETAQLTLTPSSVEASLRGSTYDFRAILGADAVRVVQ